MLFVVWSRIWFSLQLFEGFSPPPPSKRLVLLPEATRPPREELPDAAEEKAWVSDLTRSLSTRRPGRRVPGVLGGVFLSPTP